MVDGALSFRPAGRGARGAEGGEEERGGRGGWVEAWPGGGVGGLEGVQFVAGGRVREIAPGVGVYGGDGRVGEERFEDFGALGQLVGEHWGIGGRRRGGGKRTTRPVLPARAADVIVVVNCVKLMVDSMEKLESQ